MTPPLRQKHTCPKKRQSPRFLFLVEHGCDPLQYETKTSFANDNIAAELGSEIVKLGQDINRIYSRRTTTGYRAPVAIFF